MLKSPRFRKGKERKQELAGERTALDLIAHVAAVIPAIALLDFGDADARGTGEHTGAGCLEKGQNRGMEQNEGSPGGTANVYRIGRVADARPR